MKEPHLDDRHQEDVGRVRRVGVSLVWSQVGRASEIGLGFLFSIIVVRALGPQDYAIYAVAWSIISIAALLASRGYNEALVRYLPALCIKDTGEASTLLRRLLFERTLISLVVAIGILGGTTLLSVWTRTPALESVIGIIAVLVVTYGVLELLAAYYVAALRMRDYAAVRIVGQLTSLGLGLVLFIGFGIHVWVPLVALLAGYVVGGVLYLLAARQVLLARGSKVDLGEARRFSGYVWLTNLATFGLASQVDVLLIAALLTDSTQISFYNVAVLLLSRLYAVLTGWNAVLMPAAAEARARDGDTALAHNFNAYMKVNLVMLVPLFVFVSAWSGPLMTSLFGNAFVLAASTLRVFAVFALMSALFGANVCHPLLYVADRQRTLLWLRLAAGLLNILLDVLLIPLLGAVGAAIATSSSNLATHLAEFVLLRRITGAVYPNLIAVKLLSASVLACLPALFIAPTGIVSLIGGAVLFAAIFVITAWRIGLFSPSEWMMLADALPRLRPVLHRLAILETEHS